MTLDLFAPEPAAPVNDDAISLAHYAERAYLEYALSVVRGARYPLDDGQGNFDQTLYFGSAFTIIRNPKDELKTGTFHAMCSQLGIKSSDL